MARPRTPKFQPESEQPLLKVPRDDLRQELDERIEAGLAFLNYPMNTPAEYEAIQADYYTWDEYNEELLRRRFTGPQIADEYSNWFGIAGGLDLDSKIRELHEDIRMKVRRLESIRDRLNLIDEAATTSRASQAAPAAGATTEAAVESIFIVHGHDGEAKLAVHGFLRAATKVDPVILHDLPNGGMTVIEKFEKAGTAAGFAVIVLTADDLGKAKDADELQARGRQNVVFEYGYFVGALGRARTVVLHEEGVEIPSDLGGLVYVPYDKAGAWKMLIARELKHAGIEVDANALL